MTGEGEGWPEAPRDDSTSTDPQLVGIDCHGRRRSLPTASGAAREGAGEGSSRVVQGVLVGICSGMNVDGVMRLCVRLIVVFFLYFHSQIG